MVEGNDVAIIACGVLVHEALNAAEQLKSEGINATVVDMHTIKPLDTDLIDKLAKQCGAIVTAEDHSVIGGLGGAISEHVVHHILFQSKKLAFTIDSENRLKRRRC